MKVVAQNRRAKYDYQILDTIEVGIILTGQEVKSCRQGNMNLAGSYVSLLGNKPMLKNASIAAYKHASGLENYNPGRDRGLLMKKAELKKIEAQLAEKGVSVVPLEVRAGRYIKVLLGLGKGKKKLDKRHSIKEREISRKMKKGEDY